MFTFLVLVVRFAISVLISFVLGYSFTAIALLIAPSAASVMIAFMMSFLVSLWIDIVFARQLLNLSVFISLSVNTIVHKAVEFIVKGYDAIVNFIDNIQCNLFNKNFNISRI